MKKVEISGDWCKGCELCFDACPKGLLEKGDGANAKGFYPARCRDDQACTGCALCALICPDLAIEVYR